MIISPSNITLELSGLDLCGREIGRAGKQMLIDNVDVTRQSWAEMRCFCYVMCCSEVVIDSSRLAWQRVVQWSKAAGWML